MSMLKALVGVLSSVQPITVSANWGVGPAGAIPTSWTSATRTLTVPSGNPGSLKFSLSQTGDGTANYSKNGGGFTPFADGDVISVASGDTLALRNAFISIPGSTIAVTVTDNTTHTSIGTWSAP